jgi:plasmid maintenance system antidote protein VapI
MNAKTGNQFFDENFGGFESGKVYCVFGAPKSGKTSFMAKAVETIHQSKKPAYFALLKQEKRAILKRFRRITEEGVNDFWEKKPFSFDDLKEILFGAKNVANFHGLPFGMFIDSIDQISFDDEASSPVSASKRYAMVTELFNESVKDSNLYIVFSKEVKEISEEIHPILDEGFTGLMIEIIPSKNISCGYRLGVGQSNALGTVQVYQKHCSDKTSHISATEIKEKFDNAKQLKDAAINPLLIKNEFRKKQLLALFDSIFDGLQQNLPESSNNVDLSVGQSQEKIPNTENSDEALIAGDEAKVDKYWNDFVQSRLDGKNEKIPFPIFGELIRQEFIIPSGFTESEIAHFLDVEITAFQSLLDGYRPLNICDDFRLSHFFGMSKHYFFKLEELCLKKIMKTPNIGSSTGITLKDLSESEESEDVKENELKLSNKEALEVVRVVQDQQDLYDAIEAQNAAFDCIKVNSFFGFGKALKKLIKGECVARDGWSRSGMALSIVKGDVNLNLFDENISKIFEIPINLFDHDEDKDDVNFPYFNLWIDGKNHVWTPTATDIFSRDWYVTY